MNDKTKDKTMSLSMYELTVPVFVRGLENLSTVLKKGEAFAKANGISEADFVTARLAEDMFPLTRQVQIASDAAKGAGARLSGAEVPSFADTETTFAELQERIAKTIGFLKSVDAQGFEGSEAKSVELKVGPNQYKFMGKDFLLGFAYPNFYFHITTAYGILRHKGVDLGKMDYLGAVPR